MATTSIAGYNQEIHTSKSAEFKMPTDLMSKGNGLKSCLSSNNLCEKTEMKRNVSFHTIQFREFYYELGDNPSCSRGVPITLGWDYDEEHNAFDLDHYESVKGESRTKTQLRIPEYARQQLVKNKGYSRKEIQAAIKKTNIVRAQRKATAHFAPTLKEKTSEVFESATRKIWKVVSNRAADRELKSLFEKSGLKIEKKNGRYNCFADFDKNNNKEGSSAPIRRVRSEVGLFSTTLDELANHNNNCKLSSSKSMVTLNKVNDDGRNIFEDDQACSVTEELRQSLNEPDDGVAEDDCAARGCVHVDVTVRAGEDDEWDIGGGINF